MKEKINKLKENWNDPRKKILIKFGLYGIFFLIIYIFIFISNSLNDFNKVDVIEEEPVINYSKMKNELKEKEIINVKYKIGNIFIEGIVQDNTLFGTVELEDGTIYKIKYYDNNLYQVIKDEETLNNDLITNINLEYLLPINILNIINDYEGVSSLDETSYSYNIENVAYTVYIKDEKIEKIVILDNLITYNLEFN